MKMYMVCACVLALTACGGAAATDPITDSCCNNDPSTPPNPMTDGGNAKDCCSTTPEAGTDAGTPTSDAGPTVCTEGARQCNGTTAQACTGGKFTDVTVCGGASPVCDQGLCVECTTGQTACVGTAPRSCVAGKWQYEPACSGNNAVCMDGTCVQCSPGSNQCNGNTPQTCGPKGTWQSQTSCSGLTPICRTSDVTCVQCNVGDSKCVGLDSYTCDNTNTWQKVQTCSYVCSGAGVCGVCKPNSVQCLTDTACAQTCDATGHWYSDPPGPEGGACSYCTPGCSSYPQFNVNDTAKTVTDSSTGLVWQRMAKYTSPGYISYSDAVAYCTNKGGSWRLPTQAEMAALGQVTATASPGSGGTCNDGRGLDETVFPGGAAGGAGPRTYSTGWWTSVSHSPGTHWVDLDGDDADSSLHNVMCVHN
jgi:hypothetical protein